MADEFPGVLVADRDQLLAQLLGCLGSQENVVARLSKSHPVMAALGLQRKIIAFLANGSRLLQIVAGPEGSGKSFLLESLEKRTRAMFPLLSIHSSWPSMEQGSGHSRALSLLRELWRAHSESDEISSLTPNEILHNGPSFLRRISAQSAGIILIVDDLFDMCGGNLPYWLPCPLPPGLHVVGSSCQDRLFCTRSEMMVGHLGPVSSLEQQAFFLESPSLCTGMAVSALDSLKSAGLLLAPRSVELIVHLITLEPQCWKDLLVAATEITNNAEGQLSQCPFDVTEMSNLPGQQLVKGSRVRVHGLQNIAQLNGAQGKCTEWNCERKRWKVWLQDGTTKLVKPENLAVVEVQWDAQGVTALAILLACEKRHGKAVVGVFNILSRVTCGLTLVELGELVSTAFGGASVDLEGVVDVCEPLLHKGSSESQCAHASYKQQQEATSPLERYRWRGHFALRACTHFLRYTGYSQECDGTIPLCIARYFMSMLSKAPSDVARDIDEVAVQFSKLDALSSSASDSIIEFSTSRVVLKHFSDKAQELTEMWRRTKCGCAGVAERLKKDAAEQEWSASDRVLAGKLLSFAGEFDSARDLMQQANMLLKGRSDESQRGEILVMLASNEVRYWDSLRNWRSVDVLKLLLDSAAEAISIFRLQGAIGFAERQLFARALSRRANGCFKAGCVCEAQSAQQGSFFQEADACVAEAVGVLKGLPCQVLGEAVLVGGVTSLCKAHSLQRQAPFSALSHSLDALWGFYHAEAVLRRAVGPMNEKSIYTHGNLAELYLSCLAEPLFGLLHFRQCCVVSVQVFGAQHPNAKRKLGELADIFEHASWNDFAALIRSGQPERIDTSDLPRRLSILGAGLEGPHRNLISERLSEMSSFVDFSFWSDLWKDLGHALFYHSNV